ncbi:MAG TPA: helix-turn-helix domain-containing protein [Geodermatophilus sp.]|nr:helix-turn-helix domain-containing protein [Geodermatophilus sp.]
MSRTNPTRMLQDVETEEVLHVLTPKVRCHRQPFTMIFCDALLALLCTVGRRHEDDDPMRPVHWRVLLYLLASAEYKNRLDRFVTEIADELNNDRSTVSKALDLLEERESRRPLLTTAATPVIASSSCCTPGRIRCGAGRRTRVCGELLAGRARSNRCWVPASSSSRTRATACRTLSETPVRLPRSRRA